jgi:site-specific DNA-cytosine methylase
LDHMCSVTGELGYSSQAMLTDAAAWGIPQRRKRVYVVGLHKAATLWDLPDENAFNEFWQRYASWLPSIMIKPPELNDVLLHDVEPPESQAVSLDPGNASRSSKGAAVTTQWQQQHMDFCRRKNIRFATLGVSEESCASPWYQTLCERKQNLLAIVEKLHGPGTSCDLSQSARLS